MNIVVMFLIVLILIIIFRTVKINYTSKRTSNFTSKKTIILNRVFNFIIKEAKFVIYLYIALVGMYVLIEKMFRYDIYPANLQNINYIFSIIHDMNTNLFISRMYVISLSSYVVLLLPYRLIKLYNDIITDINIKDYIQLFIVNNLHKIEIKQKIKRMYKEGSERSARKNKF